MCEKDNIPLKEVNTDEVDSGEESSAQQAIDSIDHLGLLYAVANIFYNQRRFMDGLVGAQRRTFLEARSISNIPFEDVVQDGYFGLHRAAERFDPERGFRFSTFAVPHIGAVMVRRSMGYLPVRMPVHAFDSYVWGDKRFGEPIRTSSLEERPDYYSYGDDSEEQLDIAEELMPTVPLTDTVDLRVEDEFERLEQSMYAQATVKQLMEISELTEREIDIIEKRFGFLGEPMTLEEIALGYGLTGERIRQIEARVLDKLRSAIVDIDILSKKLTS